MQRVFAIIELLRAVGAFLVAPILLHIALTTGGKPTTGTNTALWTCFAISIFGTLIGVCLYVLSGERPPAPSLERWGTGQEPAWDSPPLLARVRQQSSGSA